MQNVRVNRLVLVDVVRKNRNEHAELFRKAQDGFRERVIEELDEMLRQARDHKVVRTVVQLVPPEDHTTEYDRALQMLEMSVDETVEVDVTTFAQLVRNEWAWFDRASVTNMTYASGGKLERK